MVHSNQGGEFKNAVLQSFCTKRGIMIHLTKAYTPMQNGTVERVNRTIGNDVRAMRTGGGAYATPERGFLAFAIVPSCFAVKQNVGGCGKGRRWSGFISARRGCFGFHICSSPLPHPPPSLNHHVTTLEISHVLLKVVAGLAFLHRARSNAYVSM